MRSSVLRRRARAVVTLPLCLAAVVLTVPSSSAGAAELQWDPVTKHTDGTPVTNLAGYKIYYGDAATPPFEGKGAVGGDSPVDIPIPTLTDPTKPGFVLKGFPSCKKVYFAATAYNTSGNESDFSKVLEVVLAASPQGVTVTPGASEGTLMVKWTPPSGTEADGISGYKVHYDVDSGAPYEGVGAAQGASPIDVPVGSSGLQLTGLPAGTKVFVTVESVCAGIQDTFGHSKEAEGAVAAPVCGNDVIETNETCEPSSTCPTSCDDGVVCTEDALFGSPSQCSSSCTVTVIETCFAGDGCCPIGCDTTTDSDCSASCGNGTLEEGETCDPASSCPTACDDGDACTNDWLSGNPDFCSSACSHTPVVECKHDDGCCPAGCRALIDNDCKVEAPPPGSGPVMFGDSRPRLVGSCSIDNADNLLLAPSLLLLLALLLLRRRGSKPRH